MAEHGIAGTADAGALLSRLVRLDAAALVRLRPAAAGRIELWCRVPWGVLVGRTVAGRQVEVAGDEPTTGAGPAGSSAAGSAPAGSAGGSDATVLAAELLARLEAGAPQLPVRRDADWRWALPPSGARTVEELPVGELRRVSAAAQEALRAAAAHGVRGRAVGQRALRDALLDHVPIVVAPAAAGAAPVQVPQRLVQAVTRMGFLGADRPGADDRVLVRVAGGWTGLLAPYGVAWLAPVGPFTLRPRTGAEESR
ncbi:hypothetical protein [Plantactinospora sp. KBS50]|uniref:hypothetical protein n=1 Tax=Plantactinospora sp. KBS50 TaxID=2024580 RepID=UPI000BAAFD82|nr:hypothetical protein [Plantactinospora sp. KBS50]ASW56329.1 hypothetical protein CIK06_22480 [Plantactinospora sp. KBS50]